LIGWATHHAQKASWNQQPDFSHFDTGMGQNWIDRNRLWKITIL
jgi:hypothetical protein